MSTTMRRTEHPDRGPHRPPLGAALAAPPRSTSRSRRSINAFRERHRKADTDLHRAGLRRRPATPTPSRSAARASPTSRTRSASRMILADLGLDDVTIAAALLHDAVEDTSDHRRRHRAGVRRRRRRHRRRRHQARPAPVRLQGGAAGGHPPQDARGDGQGHPGPAHQARRPPPQHAHDRVAARVQAAAHRAGDPRHLRAARAPPRHRRREVAARGPRVRGAAPEALRRDRADGRRRRRPSARSYLDARAHRAARPARRAAHRRRGRAAGRSTTGRSTRRWSSRASSSTTSRTSSACASSSSR